MKAIESDIFQTDKAITKFLRQTQSKELVWKNDSRKLSLGAEEYVIGKVYFTEVLKKHLRIFKYKYKYFTEYEEFTWIDGIRLQFTDWDGNSEWEFPTARSIEDLYEAVLFQTSNIEDFLEKWLSE